MLVEVRPVYVKGQALRTAVRRDRPAYRGQLRVREERLESLGRAVMCAWLKSATDGVDTDILPRLSDVQIIWLVDAAMRLRGIEEENGISYAQTWDIKVIKC